MVLYGHSYDTQVQFLKKWESRVEIIGKWNKIQSVNVACLQFYVLYG